MPERTKQQQLDVALAGWGESISRTSRSKLASALASNPEPEAQDVLRQLHISLETKEKELKDAGIKFEMTIASIPWLERQEAMRQSYMALITSLKTFTDRALTGDDDSISERHEWVRKVRATYEKSANKDELIDAFFAAVQKSLSPKVNGGAAILALESMVAETLPGEPGLPRCWEILAYLLPRDSRQRIYEPARAELLEDYLHSRSCRLEWWSCLAVDGVFFVRTLILVGECARVLLASRAVQFWLWLIGLVLAWVMRLTQRPPE